MGICLSSPAEGGGAHAVDCQDCTPSSSRSWSRRKSKAGRRARKKKARRDKKRGGGLFDRRGGGGGGGGGSGGAADPAALLARVEAGGSLTEQELQRVPGRVCLSGTSDSACLFTQQGRKGTNQDAMIVWENFTSRDDTIFCGVFDGHGPYGHMVAKKVRDSLPLKLCTQWKASSNDESSLQQTDMALGSMNSEETASIGKEEWSEPIDAEEDKLPEIYHVLRQSFLKAFKLMDKELKLHPTIDCFCSGTTAVTLVKQGQDLVIGNVGDSRAVMGTRDRDNSLIAVQLTVDLKPNLPREAARIQQCKGRVFALQDEPEVARVWLPNNDSPGLAMARAFGDFCLKDYGLISVPDISYRCLTDRDEFIILATDGVWDVLSNKEAIDVVASAPTRSTAARALVDTAVRSWRLKFPTSKVDDCAVVCLFLDPECSSDFTQDGKSENSCDEAVDTNVVGSIIPQETTEKDLFESVSTSQHGGSALAQPNSPENVEILPASERKDEKLQGRCQSARSLADCMSATEEEEWSALEGVTRVNSLVNLPRFSSSDKKSTSWKKWL